MLIKMGGKKVVRKVLECTSVVECMGPGFVQGPGFDP
jgi:hypothetical protein